MCVKHYHVKRSLREIIFEIFTKMIKPSGLKWWEVTEKQLDEMCT
ncbi:hypothetical protein SLEP1_g14346 [Rubroshorea leprosula]|uniref:Transposase n=1 Tax=Rubroshorea leprosula TaxID=152421 RepID=A0AAV5IPR9_9ROSI|nr:hypothetical protein SLEP1_g14346 [Rubroshorea leprosula]